MRSRNGQVRASAHRLGAFTFAELLAAMLFVAIVVPAVVQGMTLANRAGVVADRKRIAGELADNLLTEWIVTEEWREGQRSGTFGDAWPDYRWVMVDNEWEEDTDAGMQVLSVEVFYTVQGKEYSVTLTTLAEDSEDEDTEEDSEDTGSASSG